MISEIPNKLKSSIKKDSTVTQKTSANSDSSAAINGKFVLPNRPSSRSGSQFSGLNLNFFRTN